MKALARALFLIALAAAGAIAVWSLGRRGVDTDLAAMVGEIPRTTPLGRLGALSSDAVRVVCADAARAASLCARYPLAAPPAPEDLLATLRAHGGALLAPNTRALLEKGDFDRIRRGVRRRDYTGMGLFPKADDPFYFLSDFVAGLAALEPGESAQGAVVLSGRGREVDAARPEGGLLALVDEARRDAGIWLGGAPFHTAIARRRTLVEVNLLGGISLASVLFFGWLLFGSFRFVAPTSAAIACALVAATGAVCLLPGRPHALTFLFGTTLVGLGVDYCYHALSPERRSRGFARRLAGALATTVCAFAPLVLARVAALRQMAVFSVAGLAAMFAFVLLFTRGPAADAAPRPPARAAGWPAAVFRWALVLLVPVFCVFSRPRLSSDPSAFHRPDPVMARGEARLAELAGGVSGMRLVDLTRWQKENAALLAKFGAPAKGPFLSAADLPQLPSFSQDGHDILVLPEAVAGKVFGAFGESIDLKAALEGLFARFLSESAALAGGSLLLMLAGALFLFGRRAFGVFLPPVCACAATALTLGALGEPITFFHVLCFFVMVGLGVDYAIFHQEGGKAPSRVVFFSFLTSLVGFGLLAFTSFPVTRGMGLTLAIGLFWAYGLSLPRGEGRPAPGDGPWYGQKEQSAGRFRILLLWYLYRLLGKNAAKLLFLPGYVFIYPFCRTARRALRQYYAVLGVEDRSFRHILSFAWSMLDKTDACTLCKDPPTFTCSGDTAWMKGGCFLLSTHLGCIEVMPALRKARGNPPGVCREGGPRVHAFQQMGHDAVFTRFFAARLDSRLLTLHAVEDIGVETAVEMAEAIRGGDIVLMAADRLSAGSKAVLRHAFLGRDCVWPKGVFRFAKLMEAPVFAIVCVKTGWNSYELKAARLGESILADYVAFLEAEVRRNPYQWYQFYPFFG